MSDDGKRSSALLRIFPYIEDKDRAKGLKIDTESFQYVSRRDFADKISQIIKDRLEAVNLNPKECTITDAMAGVGGNTISFAKSFGRVVAIEIDRLRYDYLKNNTSIYDLTNIEFYNADCMDIIYGLENHDVLFMDPPWGGRSYKESKSIRLKINGIDIEEICNRLFEGSLKMVVFKLPKNYDVSYFHKTIKSKAIYLFDLEKMFIFAVMNPDIEQ